MCIDSPYHLTVGDDKDHLELHVRTSCNSISSDSVCVPLFLKVLKSLVKQRLINISNTMPSQVKHRHKSLPNDRYYDAYLWITF